MKYLLIDQQGNSAELYILRNLLSGGCFEL